VEAVITNPGPNAVGELYCPVCEKNFISGERCPTDNAKLVRLTGTDPFLGRELDGRYTILEKLGAGGMGAVYRANQRSVGREVAVKVVGNLVAEPDAIKRFLREAKLAGKLDHPSAVQVLDFGQTDDGLFYLVMELIRGQTLDVMLERDGVLSPERVVRIGVQICDALECAHALSIVHRDLKPANIMVLAHGRDLIKVLDFGLAKSLSPDQTSTTMTGAGAMLGTPAFMPPELATGQRCDGRADLYSLGCILYLLGSGRLPFESDSIHELIAMHGMEPAPIMPGVPVGLARVVDRLLAKDPGDRFQTAAETREALEDCLDPTRATIYDSRTSYPALATTPPIATPMPINVPVTAAAIASTVRPASRRADSVAKPKRRRWLWFVLAGALAGGGAAAVFVLNSEKPAIESKTIESNVSEPKPAAESKPPTEPKPKTDAKAPDSEVKQAATPPAEVREPAAGNQAGSAVKPDKPDKPPEVVVSPPVKPVPAHLKPHSVKPVKPPVKDSPPTVAPPTPTPPTPTPPTPTPPTKPDEPKLPF
jgi:eukaryotic-like serine/threonine-protein kinase